MKATNNSNMVVVLGGMDAEMLEIKRVCTELSIYYIDRKLSWGENSSVHAEAIAEALSNGREVIMIEPLTKDYDGNVVYQIPTGVLVIDHHSDQCHKPASLTQFCELVGYPMNRKMQLIAANDAGAYEAMRKIGASVEEIKEIRKIDQIAQGVSPEQFDQALEAYAKREVINGVTVVRCEHSKCAPITDADFLAAEGEYHQNILILSNDGEVNYYGDETLCSQLEGVMKGMGATYTYSAATYAGGNPRQEEILNFIVNFFA